MNLAAHRFKPGRLSLLLAGSPLFVSASFVSACLPTRDLDATAAGSAVSGASGDTNAGGSDPGAQSHGGTSGSTASSGGAAPSDGGAPAAGDAGDSSGGNASVAGGSTGGVAGGGHSGGAGGTQPLSDLPTEMNDSPVTGTLQVASEASWTVNGTTEPAFKVDTPTATYFVVKKLGMIVSLTNAIGSARHEWINYSDSFRPHRGLPNLGTCCEADATATLTTTLDMDTITPGHLRLVSSSSNDAWALVWDFYRTHVTLTVNHAPQTFSFGYRGTPGGSLDSADRFVTSTGQSYPALSSVFDQAFAGAVQWAYLADDGDKRSLFLVQHAADGLNDHYGVDKTDTAVVSFGAAGGISAPLRFSFGLVESAEDGLVAERVKYVIASTPAR